MYLLLTCVAVGADPLGGEEVGGGDLPDLAPVLTVGCEGNVRRAVEEDVGDGGARARGEDVVVRARDGLRGARRRDHHRRHGAEVDQQEPPAAAAAVLGREVTEGHVREGPHEVEVPYDGEPPRW